jgi:uncharacterized protein YutE (UPF0331/DUF86 family)
MVRREVVSQKVTRAAGHINDAAALLNKSVDVFIADVQGRDLAAFYLMLSIQECIDLAAHWVADAGWPAASDAGGAFEELANRGVIGSDLAVILRGAVGVRNRIAHGYGSIDHARLHQEATVGIPALQAFLSVAAAAAGL